MYVCLCNGLTDRDVKSAVNSGANTVSRVYKAHGCSAQCGKCACQIKDMLGTQEGRPANIGGAVLAPSR